MSMRLWIGNRNYSSWSIRPWFFVRHAKLPCEERVLYMDEASFAEDVRVSPSKRVPVLELDGGDRVWDTLAIGLTLAELFPEAHVFPSDARVRRLVYSACAEMHSGFGEMRRVLTCNARKRYAKDAWKTIAGGPEACAAVLADCARIEQLFETLLEASTGPFLGGAEVGYVDAYFVPVLSRFRTYGLELGAVSEAYAKRIEALPTHVTWLELAREEPHTIAKYEYALPLA